MPETVSSNQAALLFSVMLVTAQCLPWMLILLNTLQYSPSPVVPSPSPEVRSP
jgi:hypothetical protein